MDGWMDGDKRAEREIRIKGEREIEMKLSDGEEILPIGITKWPTLR